MFTNGPNVLETHMLLVRISPCYRKTDSQCPVTRAISGRFGRCGTRSGSVRFPGNLTDPKGTCPKLGLGRLEAERTPPNPTDPEPAKKYRYHNQLLARNDTFPHHLPTYTPYTFALPIHHYTALYSPIHVYSDLYIARTW